MALLKISAAERKNWVFPCDLFLLRSCADMMQKRGSVITDLLHAWAFYNLVHAKGNGNSPHSLSHRQGRGLHLFVTLALGPLHLVTFLCRNPSKRFQCSWERGCAWRGVRWRREFPTHFCMLFAKAELPPSFKPAQVCCCLCAGSVLWRLRPSVSRVPSFL